MKAAYYHPGEPVRSTGAMTPMRAALGKAGIDVVDVDDAVGIDTVDVWIWEGGEAGGDSALGLQIREDMNVPFVVVEPDARIAISDDRDAALQISAQATRVVTTSSTTAQYFERIKPDCVTLLPPFIDVDPFRAADKIRPLHKPRLASTLHLPESTPWLLTDGEMEAGDSLKSYEVLVRALSRLLMLDWRLIVITSGNAISEAKELLLYLPQDRICFCEPMPVPEFAALCVSCDMYVWPAIGDSAPGSLLAAQAGGLPVIAGRKGDTEDRVVDGRTGRLTPMGNAESFANAVSFLLRHPDFKQSFSDEARDMVKAQFDMDAAASRLREILTALCE